MCFVAPSFRHAVVTEVAPAPFRGERFSRKVRREALQPKKLEGNEPFCDDGHFVGFMAYANQQIDRTRNIDVGRCKNCLAGLVEKEGDLFELATCKTH